MSRGCRATHPRRWPKANGLVRACHFCLSWAFLGLAGGGVCAQAGPTAEELAAWLPTWVRQGAAWRVRACTPIQTDPAQALAAARLLALRDLARQRGESRLLGREQWAQPPAEPKVAASATEGYAVEIRQELLAQVGAVRVLREAILGQGAQAMACVEIEERSKEDKP